MIEKLPYYYRKSKVVEELYAAVQKIIDKISADISDEDLSLFITTTTDFSTVDKKLAETEKKTAAVQLSDRLEVVSASGSVSFYHGTSTPFTSILHSVKTTLGDAVFRNKYGTVSASAGSRISVAVTLEVVGGVIYWDEYYNGASGGEVSIGTTTLTQTSTGDTIGYFSYTNSAASEPKTLELRDAILELAQQIQALRKE